MACQLNVSYPDFACLSYPDFACQIPTNLVAACKFVQLSTLTLVNSTWRTPINTRFSCFIFPVSVAIDIDLS